MWVQGQGKKNLATRFRIKKRREKVAFRKWAWPLKGDDNINKNSRLYIYSIFKYISLSSSLKYLSKLSLYTKHFKYKVFICALDLDICLECAISKKLQLFTVMGQYIAKEKGVSRL
jgi:hypothetical protein